jgi:hypothetical protein
VVRGVDVVWCRGEVDVMVEGSEEVNLAWPAFLCLCGSGVVS